MHKEFNKCKFYTIAPVITASTVRSFNLDQNSPLNNSSVVSVRTRRAGTNVRTLGGKQIVSDVVFDAARLVLKADTQTIVADIPLVHIERASIQSPETGFLLYFEGLNWNNCQIEVAEGVSLSGETDKAVELTIEYFEPKKSK